jgi:hypothetical protein
MLKRTTTRKLLLQSLSRYFQSMSADLRHGPMGDCATTQERGDADDSVISCKSHFSR